VYVNGFTGGQGKQVFYGDHVYVNGFTYRASQANTNSHSTTNQVCAGVSVDFVDFVSATRPLTPSPATPSTHYSVAPLYLTPALADVYLIFRFIQLLCLCFIWCVILQELVEKVKADQPLELMFYSYSPFKSLPSRRVSYLFSPNLKMEESIMGDETNLATLCKHYRL